MAAARLLRRCTLARARLSALVTDSAVDVQHPGHLAGVEAEDVAQDEHGELARRKQLKRGHERQRDRLGLLVARLGTGRRVGRALEENVGKRLQPHDLAEPASARAARTPARPTPSRPPAGRATRVEAPVGRDPVQPGAQRGAPRTRRARQAASIVSWTASSASATDPSIR